MQYTPIAGLEEDIDREVFVDERDCAENDGRLIDAIIDQLNGKVTNNAVDDNIDPQYLQTTNNTVQMSKLEPTSDSLVSNDDIDKKDMQTSSPSSSQGNRSTSPKSDFWVTAFQLMRDPLVVGVVVALLSSKRIQQRLLEFVPMVMSDNMQGTFVRFMVGIAMYMLIKRLL